MTPVYIGAMNSIGWHPPTEPQAEIINRKTTAIVGKYFFIHAAAFGTPYKQTKHWNS